GGELHLVGGLGTDQFYMEGDVLLAIDYKPAVEGRGQIGFGAYSNGVWLIAGAASVDILGGLVSGEADMFASASGFAASFRTATPIPLDGMGFLTLEETEATVF